MKTKRFKRIVSASMALTLSLSLIGGLSNSNEHNGIFNSVSASAAISTSITIDPITLANKGLDYYFNSGNSYITTVTVYENFINDNAYMQNVVAVLSNCPNISTIKYYNSNNQLKTVKISQLADVAFYDKCVDTIVASLDYQDNRAIGNQMLKRVRTIANNITRNCTCDYDKVKAIYDYLIDNTVYSSTDVCKDAKRLGTEWAAFCNRDNKANDKKPNVTCGGYSIAFALLARSVGIKAYLASAWKYELNSNGEKVQSGHEFNVVKINGGYYYVDASNDNCLVNVRNDKSKRYYNFLLDCKSWYENDSNHQYSPSFPIFSWERKYEDYKNGRRLVLTERKSLNEKFNYELPSDRYSELPKTIYNNSFTLFGDLNGDRKVNNADVEILNYCEWGIASYQKYKTACDLDGNGVVNRNDYLILLNRISKQG